MQYHSALRLVLPHLNSDWDALLLPMVELPSGSIVLISDNKNKDKLFC
jgi:hypothetical protein